MALTHERSREALTRYAAEGVSWGDELHPFSDASGPLLHHPGIGIVIIPTDVDGIAAARDRAIALHQQGYLPEVHLVADAVPPFELDRLLHAVGCGMSFSHGANTAHLVRHLCLVTEGEAAQRATDLLANS